MNIIPRPVTFYVLGVAMLPRSLIFFAHAAFSTAVTTYPSHSCVLLYFLSEFYRYLRLRFLLCRRSLLGSTFPKFPKGISFLSVFTRVEPRVGEHLRGNPRVLDGRSSGIASRSDPFRKNMVEYHKKKIKEIKYVWSRHTFDHH